MKQSKFEWFRQQRRIELRNAMSMLWVLQSTMPTHRYNSMMREMLAEINELNDDGVIYFHHLKLLRDDVKYKRE